MPPPTVRWAPYPYETLSRPSFDTSASSLPCLPEFSSALSVAWFWVSKYYVAKMQVIVEQTRSDPTISAGQNVAVVTSRAPSPDVVGSEIALLQGQDMMREVAQTCGFADRSSWLSDILLPRDPERRRAAKLEKAALSVGKAVKAEAEKGSDVINVKFGSIGSPEAPACVLQNLGKLYLSKRLLLRRPVGTSTFFAEQTEKYNRDLAEVENKLANFGREQGVAAPDAMRPFLAQQVAMSVAALHTAEQAIAADEARLAGLQKQLQETPERIVTQQTTNAANSLLQNLESSLLESQVKRTHLREIQRILSSRPRSQRRNCTNASGHRPGQADDLQKRNHRPRPNP